MQEQIRANGKHRTQLFAAAGLLFLLVTASTVLLCSRLGFLSDASSPTVIELLADNAGGSAETQAPQADPDESASVSEGTHQARPAAPQGGMPGFETADDQHIWSTDTHVDIFRITYENGEDKITAAGADGDKIVAPGTSGSSSFRVSNTGKTALDYQMTVEAYFGDDELPIPVVVRFSDYNGTFFAGSEGGWASVSDLNRVRDSAVLAKNHYARYTLEWQWPFEGNDGYDTMLGNLAVDGDITLTVVIRTTATEDKNPDAGGGIPQTGDDASLMFWLIIAVLSCTVMIFLLLFMRRGKKESVNDKEQ